MTPMIAQSNVPILVLHVRGVGQVSLAFEIRPSHGFIFRSHVSSNLLTWQNSIQSWSLNRNLGTPNLYLPSIYIYPFQSGPWLCLNNAQIPHRPKDVRHVAFAHRPSNIEDGGLHWISRTFWVAAKGPLASFPIMAHNFHDFYSFFTLFKVMGKLASLLLLGTDN